MNTLNHEVSAFLDAMNHPLREEIERLRHLIMNATPGLSENIKWNGPNYCVGENDRITMKIQPPKQIQLIFHRGAKKQDQPKDKIISSTSKLLTWKENDRAIAAFKNSAEIEAGKEELKTIVDAWIKNTI